MWSQARNLEEIEVEVKDVDKLMGLVTRATEFPMPVIGIVEDDKRILS